MHDIWNPWHGCVKCSEGCRHCYMYFLDGQRGKNGAEIYRTKTGFRYPLSRDRAGNYKVQSGEQLRVCMTSDFFLEEADPWRREAWEIIDQRRDVVFFLLTKRPCHFDWVQSLHRQCRAHNVTFSFIETGTNFVKDGRRYFMPNKRVQSEMAYKSGMSFQGKPMHFLLEDEYGEIPPERLYKPYFGPQCKNCGGRLTCNGCARCARCMVLDPKAPV